MALFTLEALVLRGVAVRDGVALNLRLGTSVAGTQAPAPTAAPANNPRRSTPSSCWPISKAWALPGMEQPGHASHPDYGVAGTAPGAGRPHGLAGRRTSELRPNSPACPTLRSWCARSAGSSPITTTLTSTSRVGLGGWATEGGLASAAAYRSCRIPADAVATVSEALAFSPSAKRARALPAGKRPSKAWTKPVTAFSRRSAGEQAGVLAGSRTQERGER